MSFEIYSGLAISPNMVSEFLSDMKLPSSCASGAVGTISLFAQGESNLRSSLF